MNDSTSNQKPRVRWVWINHNPTKVLGDYPTTYAHDSLDALKKGRRNVKDGAFYRCEEVTNEA